ncbi:DppC ABC-type dipeptide/oligopeptide/nickel transport systems, permease components [Rhabdaerophilaceae bacterium]
MLIVGLCALVFGLSISVGHDPVAQDLMKALQPASAQHILGLDHLGRDVFARLVHGAPRSIGLALFCVMSASVIGIGLGLFAAIGGKLVDALIMRLADLMLAFPGILLALLFAGLMGGGIVPMLIGITLTLWPQFARMSRSVALGELQEPHVEAARLAGFPEHTILTRHIVPPVIQQTMPLATLGIGSAVMSISSLGFLGLGLQPPIPEWGAMINEMLPYMADAPIQIAAPCLALFLTVFGFALYGRSVSDRINRRAAAI